MLDGTTLRLWREYGALQLQALSDRTGAADRLRELAEDAYRAGQQELGIRCLRRGAQLADKPTAFYIDLGALHYERGEYQKARDAFARADASDFGNVDALRGRAMSHHMLGEYDGASYYYLAALAGDPTDYDSRLNLGLVYHVQGRLDDAAEQLGVSCGQADELVGSEQYFPHLALGRVLYDQAQFDQAEASLSRAVELNPQDAESYRFLGLSQESNERPKEALASYRRAIELDPDDAYSHLNLADLLIDEGEARLALEHARLALRLFEPQNAPGEQAKAYWAIGWAYYSNREWRESAAASRAALELDPGLTAVRFNLGLALLREGLLEESRRVYEETIAGPLSLWDLETHGIDDLTALLREEPGAREAKEILETLEAKRRELISSVEPETPREIQGATASQPTV